MIKSIFRRLIRGAKHSDKYGNHPGTNVMLVLITMGGLIGLESGYGYGFVFGSSLMAFFFFPIWLVGCWNRGDV